MYGSIHTHFESQYDTGNDKETMVKNFIASGAKKVAVTEHGVFSSYEDLRDIVSHIKEEAEKEKKENPNVEIPDFDIIPGVEGYFGENAAHLILIAKDYEGYLSLCKIISESNKNIIREKPIITFENLQKNVKKGHLICTSACIAGPFGRLFGLEKINIEEKITELEKEISESGYREYISFTNIYAENKKQAKAIRPTKKDIVDAEKAKKKNGNEEPLKEIEERIQKADELDKWLADNKQKNTESELALKKIKKAVYARKQSNLEKYKEELANIKEQVASGEMAMEAQALLYDFLSIFGKENFYFEIQNHGLDKEKEIYNNVISFAYQAEHPHFIASNDIHVGVRKEDPTYEDMLKRRNVIKYTRFNKYQEETEDDKEYVIKNDTELREELLKIVKPVDTGLHIISPEDIVDQAIGNIEGVLKDCAIEFPQNENHYPKFCDDENAEFERKVREGIKIKFPNGFPKGKEKIYEERLEYELGIIKKMGYAGYHLIVADYLEYGRLLGYLPSQEEIENAPLSVKELDAYITQKGYPRIGYSIGPGRGCSKKGGMVYTKFGAKPIEEVDIGDEVYDYTGKLCPVLKRWEYPVKEELLNITIWNGGKVSYTKDHKFYSASAIPVTNKMKLAQGYRYADTKPETDFEWKKAEDLKQGDWVAIPRMTLPLKNEKVVFDLAKYASSKYTVTDTELFYTNTDALINKGLNITALAKYLKMSKSTIRLFFNNSSKVKPYTAEKITEYLKKQNVTVEEWRSMGKKISIPRFISLNEELAYLIGYYIADGWYHSNECNLAYNFETEQDYAIKIHSSLRNILGQDISIKDVPNTSKKCHTIQILCAPFAALMADIVPGKAQVKQIPQQILNTSEENIKAFLLGLFDGDGSYCEEYRAKYSTCNKKLAYEIKQILLHFGIACCVRSYKRKNSKWNDEWTVSFSTCEEAMSIFPKMTTSKRQTSNCVSYIDKNYIYMRIKTIEKEWYEGNVYDLTVDTPNEHSYCTDVCAVHNSGAGSLCCYGMGITDIDPIPHGLLFERFLNTERVSMPDIDSDFRTDIREKVIDYCRARYGAECICQIMTKSFGAIKGNLRLAARYLGSIECSSSPKYKELEQELADINFMISSNPEIKAQKEELEAEIKNTKKQMRQEMDESVKEELALSIESMEDALAELSIVAESVKNSYKEKKEAVIKEMESFLKTWYNRADKLAKEYDELGENLPDVTTLTSDSTEQEALTQIMELASTLDGVFTGYGQHAAGTIISGDDVSGIIPLMWNDKKGSMETQCTMAQAEAKGLLKMDFLGLNNLDIITEILRKPTKTTELYRFLKEKNIPQEYLDNYLDNTLQDYARRDEMLEDTTIYKDIFCTGLTQGVFQFESPGMKKMLVDFQPESFGDIILLVATYRPGPIDYIPEIIASKWYNKFNGDYQKYSEKIKQIYPFSLKEYDDKKRKGLAYFYDRDGNVLNYVPHSITLQNETLQKILEPTYGCPVYQEQIMQIFQQMAGYSLGGADIVRRYMSKKKVDKLAKEKHTFIFGDEERGIPGCMKLHGVTEKEADDLFEQMMPFAKYGFNKSHAEAYAMVAMFTAYLKKYHTADFFRSSLNAVKALSEIPDFVSEMPAFGLTFKAPSMQDSRNTFSVEDDGRTIRYGLKYVKGFSEQNVHRCTNMQSFIEQNPGISLKIVEKYAQLGMFEDCWNFKSEKNRHVNGNRHECLRWLKKNGETLVKYLALVEKIDNLQLQKSDIEIQMNSAKEEEFLPLKKEFDKLSRQILTNTDKRKELAAILNDNFKEDILHSVIKETPEEILENREWEIDLLSLPFDTEESLEKVQFCENKKTFDDLKISIEANNGFNSIRIPAVVLSVSDQKKTKSGTNTYYDVTLMDRNRKIITRRFDKKPDMLDGEFLLMVDECKFYTCNLKNYQELKSKSQMNKKEFQIPTNSQEFVNSVINGGKMEQIPTAGRRMTTAFSMEETTELEERE